MSFILTYHHILIHLLTFQLFELLKLQINFCYVIIIIIILALNLLYRLYYRVVAIIIIGNYI